MVVVGEGGRGGGGGDCKVMYPITFTHSPMLVGGGGEEERRRVRSMRAAWWLPLGKSWWRVRRAVVVE